MTLFERIEKKIFFKIVRSITFIVAFLALIVTIAGIYTSLSSSVDAKAKNVEIQKEEIETVLKPEPKVDSNNTQASIDTVAPVEEDAKLSELKKIAESISKKALASRDLKLSDSGYNESLGKLTDYLLQNVSSYDEKTKTDALKQLDTLSNSFKKEKFFESIDVYLSLFKSKQEHEQELADQKNISAQANKTFAYSAIGAGIVVFALFVMILVLLRIEKNTRPEAAQVDAYDATDKKLLIVIVGVAISIAILIGWMVKKTSNNHDDFDPVSQLHSVYSAANEQAVAAPVDEIAPAAVSGYGATSEENSDAVESAPVEDQGIAPAQAE
jgi:flagellar basal body-associated protein FliL